MFWTRYDTRLHVFSSNPSGRLDVLSVQFDSVSRLKEPVELMIEELGFYCRDVGLERTSGLIPPGCMNAVYRGLANVQVCFQHTLHCTSLGIRRIVKLRV